MYFSTLFSILVENIFWVVLHGIYMHLHLTLVEFNLYPKKPSSATSDGNLLYLCISYISLTQIIVVLINCSSIHFSFAGSFGVQGHFWTLQRLSVPAAITVSDWACPSQGRDVFPSQGLSCVCVLLPCDQADSQGGAGQGRRELHGTHRGAGMVLVTGLCWVSQGASRAAEGVWGLCRRGERLQDYSSQRPQQPQKWFPVFSGKLLKCSEQGKWVARGVRHGTQSFMPSSHQFTSRERQ